MRAFKMGLLLFPAITFFLACNTDHSTNHNANQNASQAPAATQSPAMQPSPGPSPAAATETPATSATNANRPVSSATANANKKEEPKPASQSAQVSKINAAELYRAQMCAGCHGAQGKSRLPGAPDFSDPAWQKKSSDAHLISVIKKGNPPLMPPYSEKLGDDEIKALVGYIRGFAK